MKSKRSSLTKKHPVPSTTTVTAPPTKAKKRRAAPKEAPPPDLGVSGAALVTPAPTNGPTPTTTGQTALSTNPIVAATAATLASSATSLQAAATAPGVPTGPDDPPAVTIPLVPSTYTPLPKGELRGVFPNAIELGGMRQGVLDLNGFVGYAALMGSAVEPASTIASTITRALAWREMKNGWATWGGYVKTEDGLAWQAAMKLLAELKPSFLLAVSKTPSLAAKYPGLTAIFGAGKKIAKKAAATKAKEAKAKAASANVAAQGTAGAAPAATDAPSAAAKAGTTGS